MNKRVLSVISIILCTAMLNGCVGLNAKKTIPANPSNTNDIKSGTPITQPASNQQADANTDYAELGFELKKQETLFILNNSLLDTDVVKLFGEPEKKSDVIVWGADGLEHQTWYYTSKGVELGFIKNNQNKQTVFSIEMQSPCTLKTSRGIGIRSTKDDVLKAYQNEINPEENKLDSTVIVAGSVYGGIIFNIENNMVTSIFIGAAAE